MHVIGSCNIIQIKENCSYMLISLLFILNFQKINDKEYENSLDISND
jgi:hypothetical protein